MHWHLLFLLSKDTFCKLFSFFLTTNDSHGTTFGSGFALYCCFYVGSEKVFIFVIQSMSFKCPLKSIKFVSYIYHIFIVYISIGKLAPVIMCDFECLFLISA